MVQDHRQVGKIKEICSVQSRIEMKRGTKKHSTTAPYWKILWWTLWTMEMAFGLGLCDDFSANSYPEALDSVSLCDALQRPEAL